MVIRNIQTKWAEMLKADELKGLLPVLMQTEDLYVWPGGKRLLSTCFQSLTVPYPALPLYE